MSNDSLSIATTTFWSQSLSQPPDLEQVFSRYVDPIHRFVYARVGNREDAEDLTSEVFLKAAKLLDRNRSEASVAQWLFTVARTVLADHWRKYYRGAATVPLEEWTALDENPPVQISSGAGRKEQLVEQVLGALPQRYRDVLELRFLRGYTIHETAAELGITPENAKVIQHRALAKAVQIGELTP